MTILQSVRPTTSPASTTDPLDEFRAWQAEAAAHEPNGARSGTLATVGLDRRPSTRQIDLLTVDHGFVFATHHGSRKGRELAADPHASYCFSWPSRGRQVVIDGTVEHLDDVASDLRFCALPRPVQLLCWASEQSRAIGDLDDVRARLDLARERFDGQEIPRPSHWGALRLVPDEIEFWSEGPMALNERRRFTRADRSWSMDLLSP